MRGYQNVLEITKKKESYNFYFDMGLGSMTSSHVVIVQSYTFLRLFIDCPQTNIIMILKFVMRSLIQEIDSYLIHTMIHLNV